ncbi:hypothetical protein Peur_016025 [Populus x canadensis]
MTSKVSFARYKPRYDEPQDLIEWLKKCHASEITVMRPPESSQPFLLFLSPIMPSTANLCGTSSPRESIELEVLFATPSLEVSV